MNHRTVAIGLLAVAFAASSAPGTLTAASARQGALSQPAAAPSAAGNAATSHAPEGVRRAGAAQSTGDVVIPGGRGFISAAAGFRSVRAEGSPEDEDFLAELAGYLSAPMVLNYAERIDAMVGELRLLQSFLADVEQRHGPVVPSLAEPGSAADIKAREMLRGLGFSVVENGGRIQLQRRVGDREARQRQMLGYLGVSVPLQSRLWAAGDPIVLRIEDERVPLLFGAAAWNDQVFGRQNDAVALFDAFMSNAEARKVLAGYAALDRQTREGLFAATGLRPLVRNAAVANGFWQIAPYLRFGDGELRVPGSDREAWQTVLGPWADTGALLTALVTKDNGRAAHLWRALALLPESEARYLLTLDRTAADQRSAWALELYRSIRVPGFGQQLRWPEDVAELFEHLRLRADNQGIDWPGGARVWLAAMADNDPLARDGALPTLMARFAQSPDFGPDADAAVLRGMLRASEPDRDEPTAIRKFLAVSAAIRYQPIGAMRDDIPLLYRNYRRFGRAYGFFVMPTPLPDGTASALVRLLQQVDAIEPNGARIDAIRQLQATMMLLQEVLLNDLLTNEDRERLVTGFLQLPVTVRRDAGSTGGVGYGTAVAQWWRTELVPSLARGLQANGWPGDPGDLRSVVVTALVGRIAFASLDVDGIDYNYIPATMLGQRVHTHLLRQQQPSFESLFRLDEIAAGLSAGTLDAGVAEEIETIVDALEAQVPPNIGDAEVTEALPVTVARSQLFARGDALVAELRAGAANPTTVMAFREAASVYLGDALVGIVYALHMGDPASFTYQQVHIAWLHRLIIAELGGDGPEDLFSPWAATAESWILDEGSRMHNSLYGTPERLARWNLEDQIPSGGPRDPAAAEAWSATLSQIHLPSLTPEAQRVVARRHALATAWIQEAAAARDPDATPSFWVSADAAPAPRLADSLRPLMRPGEMQRFVDAVRDGRESDALRSVTDGNRYLLLLALDDDDREAPAAARWLIDQMVGMAQWRRGDYLGLSAPAAVPYGEGGDEVGDALLYDRVLDLRVRLAVLMEQEGLPAPLHARLLMGAMARILSNMTPANWQPWRNVLAALDAEVSAASLDQWVVDLAFADELTPSDPTLALHALAEAGAGAGGPAGRPSTLGVPFDPAQYQAAFGAAVDMGVWNDDKEFVTDLTLDDIVVTRNGEPVTPSFLRLEGSPESSVFLDDLPPNVASDVIATPRNFVLVADMLTTSPQDWERILLDVTEFVRAGINVDDRLALVTIDTRGVPVVTHDFTVDHELIAEMLEAQVGNSFATSDREQSFLDLTVLLCDNGGCSDPGGDGTACEPIASPRFFQCVTQQADWEDLKMRLAQAQLGRWSIEASLNAEKVMSAMTQVGDMLDQGDPYDRQKYVVLLSSGFERQPGAIHYSTLVEYAGYSPSLNPMQVRTINTDLGQKIADLTTALRRCRCTVYSLGTLGQAAFIETSLALPTTQPIVSRFQARSSLQDPLNALARDTGGVPFFGSDMSVGFRNVLDDTRLRYVLGFTMEEAAPDAKPEWFQIKVEVKREHVDAVRAREGFWWPRR